MSSWDTAAGIVFAVRLLLVACVVGLALAPPAAAEVVATGVDDAALALAPNGTPRVAYVQNGRVWLVAHNAGSWSFQAGEFPTLLTPGAIVGLAAAKSSTFVLLEGVQGTWLELVRFSVAGWSAPLVAGAPAGAGLGVAGLALDRRGNPVVAWGALRANGRTTLRLWRGGRTVSITQAGFPPSDVPPPVAPLVMRDGSVRVVEGYAVTRESAAIEWRRSGRKWVGQYLFASALGAPVGAMRAAAAGTLTYAAWTQRYSTLGETRIVVARRAGREESSQFVLPHAALVDFAVTAGGYDVAANDWIPASAFDLDADVLDAGVIAGTDGGVIELDGTLLGYRVEPTGAGQFLLQREGRLEWYRTAGRPTITVAAAAATEGGSVVVTGRVSGATSGSVSVYRERPDVARTLVATAPLQPDGSFRAVDALQTRPTAYRAVYSDPATGLPLASLVRDPVR